MPRYVQIAALLSLDELEQRYRKAVDSIERSHLHMFWLLACGKRVYGVAFITGDSCQLDQDRCSELQPA
jgi:hypothetical protein